MILRSKSQFRFLKKSIFSFFWPSWLFNHVTIKCQKIYFFIYMSFLIYNERKKYFFIIFGLFHVHQVEKPIIIIIEKTNISCHFFHFSIFHQIGFSTYSSHKNVKKWKNIFYWPQGCKRKHGNFWTCFSPSGCQKGRKANQYFQKNRFFQFFDQVGFSTVSLKKGQEIFFFMYMSFLMYNERKKYFFIIFGLFHVDMVEKPIITIIEKKHYFLWFLPFFHFSPNWLFHLVIT